MELGLIPSLLLIALTKVTVLLWEKHSRIYYNYFARLETYWDLVESEVRDIIPTLKLKELLEVKVLKFYKTVSMEMLIWVQLHQLFISYNNIHLICSKCIKWTLLGTVNKKSTAETLVKNRDICVKSRYKLACYYCLESSIPILYENLCEMNDCNDSDWSESLESSDVVIKYWTHNMQKKDNCYCCNCSNIFEYSATSGNKIATEYFFQNMSLDTLKQCLVTTAIKVVRERSLNTRKSLYIRRENYSEVLYFLIAQMNTEQLQQLLQSKRDLCDVLVCFLEWPMQVHFMDMVNLSWEYFDKANYIDLLNLIIFRATQGYDDFNYRELFREFWEQSPDTHRKYLVEDDCFDTFQFLIQTKDEMNLKILLEYLPSEKRRYFFKNRWRWIIEALIPTNDRRFFEFCINEFVTSKNEMTTLRDKVSKLLEKTSSEKEISDKYKIWDTTLKLVDEYISNYTVKDDYSEGIWFPGPRAGINSVVNRLSQIFWK